MYQLICDKCGKRIDANERVLEVCLKEKFYNGNLDYHMANSCLDDSMTLCSYCARQVYEILQLHVDRFDF